MPELNSSCVKRFISALNRFKMLEMFCFFANYSNTKEPVSTSSIDKNILSNLKILVLKGGIEVDLSGFLLCEMLKLEDLRLTGIRVSLDQLSDFLQKADSLKNLQIGLHRTANLKDCQKLIELMERVFGHRYLPGLKLSLPVNHSKCFLRFLKRVTRPFVQRDLGSLSGSDLDIVCEAVGSGSKSVCFRFGDRSFSINAFLNMLKHLPYSNKLNILRLIATESYMYDKDNGELYIEESDILWMKELLEPKLGKVRLDQFSYARLVYSSIHRVIVKIPQIWQAKGHHILQWTNGNRGH
jgi:hypothetical protein